MYKNKYLYFAGLTGTIFLSRGTLFPLLSPFFQGKGFSGTQIGTIMSIEMLVSLISQVFWGVLNDKLNKTKLLLSVILLANACFIVLFPLINSYVIFIVVLAIYQFFLSGTLPLSDTLSLNSEFKYASIRQWGSIGFAVSTCVAAFLADKFNINIIFILAGSFAVISYIFLSFIKLETGSKQKKNNILKVMRDLSRNRKYVLFLVSAIFIGGSIQANNIFFGLLYISLGGSLSGIGIAFLLFALSEAPVMNCIAKFQLIKRFKIENLLLFSYFVFTIRWLWYSTSPSPKLMLIFFLLQGLSIGTYLACSIVYIKQNTKSDRTATALSIFYSVDMGFWCYTLLVDTFHS